MRRAGKRKTLYVIMRKTEQGYLTHYSALVRDGPHWVRFASPFTRRVKPYLSGEMRTRLQDSWHRTYKMDTQRTLDFRDSPVRTPRQNPVHASWPAACAANWARNVAVAPSTPGFRARPYW